MFYLYKDNTEKGFALSFIQADMEGGREFDDSIWEYVSNKNSQGISLRLKNYNGTTYEEIFEEYTLEPIPQEPSELDLIKAENKLIKAENEEIKAVLDTIIMELI